MTAGATKLLPHATRESLELVRSNVPRELRELLSWVACDRSPRLGTQDKSSKIPLNPRTGANAKSDDPSTWASFEDAVEFALRTEKAFGVGVNMGGSEFVGLDLDHVIDLDTARICAPAQALLDALPATYTEVSPSGTGLRLFFRGKKPAALKASAIRDAFGAGTAIEVYDGAGGGRYLTVTGEVLNGVRDIATVSDGDLQPLVELQNAGRRKPEPNQQPSHHSAESDDDLDRARYGLLTQRLLNPDAGYSAWFRVLTALKAFGDDGLDIAIAWSSQSKDFSVDEIRSKWPGLQGSSIGALFGMFSDADPDWRRRYWESKPTRAASAKNTTKNAAAKAEKPEQPPAVGKSPADVLSRWQADGPLVHEPTGIAALDDATGGGLVYGEPSYVIGAPDAGKTAFVVQVGDEFARRGVAVGFLAVDEGPDGALQRLLQRRGFGRRECEQRDPADLARMRASIEELPVRFYDASWSIEAAATDLAAFAQQRGARALLVVDSIQTARAAAEDDSTSLREAVSGRTAAVRSVGEHYRMLVVATSEMTRAAYRSKVEGERVNDMAAAKESGAIEYSARVLLSLRNVENESDVIELRIAKNKHGPRTRDDEPGLFLRIDRPGQRLTAVADFKKADAAAARDTMRDAQANEDAARIAVILAANPEGMPAKRCEEQARAAAGSMANDRYKIARGRLGRALVERPGPRTTVLLFLDGAEVPDSVLAAVPIADRPAVVCSRPPALHLGQPPGGARRRPEGVAGGCAADPIEAPAVHPLRGNAGASSAAARLEPSDREVPARAAQPTGGSMQDVARSDEADEAEQSEGRPEP